MDIYIVIDGPRVIGASTKLQGAELLRSDWATELANRRHPGDQAGTAVWRESQRLFYERQQVVNTELQDVE